MSAGRGSAGPLALRAVLALLLLVLLVLLVLLGSCASQPDGAVRLDQIVRATPGGEPPWVRDDDAAGVRLRRAAGGEVAARAGMRLAPGDVVVTGPGVAAVLHIGGRGQVTLDANTAVRIGSLEVLFGRLFADLRGLFAVRSETVEAVNQGTRYLFEVDRDRNVRVVVADGVLTCRSMRGGWPDLRLTAGQALVSVYPGREPPRIEPGERAFAPAEDDADRALPAFGWRRQSQQPPRAGWWCQSPGRPVVGSLEDRCRGEFSVSRDVAEARCRPAPRPEPSGWCCVAPQRRPIESTPQRCQALKGVFHDSQAAARQSCFVK